jgi:hypothetical protein
VFKILGTCQKEFVAESPEKLEELYKKIEDKYYSDIEDLYSLYEVGTSEKPQVFFNKGEKAIKDSYMDIVNALGKNEKYYRYSSTSPHFREKYVTKKYRELREKKGLERLIITNKSSYKGSERLGSRVKILPEKMDFLDDNYVQVIYGNKVSIIDLNSQSVTTIRNEKYANFQKKIFETLFNYLPEINKD